jgi:hypothetical protein
VDQLQEVPVKMMVSDQILEENSQVVHIQVVDIQVVDILVVVAEFRN